MRKAVVIGGSNGIGLAVACKLAREGKHVIIVDKCKPDIEEIEFSYKYIQTDLVDFDAALFEELSKDVEIDTLFISAGIGRICDFDKLCTTEIDKLFKINCVSITKILRIFYSRIQSNEDFYVGVMGSIAGFVGSPMFSVYSATKASVCKLIEAINAELESNGYNNRILNVSPGNIKGTAFYGEKNNISLISVLAEKIVAKISERAELYIPDYEEVYKGVIDRYLSDSHRFALESYEYKKQSGRAADKSPIVIGYLSGTFDLFHVGHLNLVRRAKAECDYLIVGVHPDASHKGKETVISFEERMAVVGACRYVDKVVPSCSEDSDAWGVHHFHKLFVGSDYKGTERFKNYENYFLDKDVEIVYFPYTKEICSTKIREIIKNKKEGK